MSAARKPIDCRRVMSQPLGVKVLGIDVAADLYGRNGYRFAGVAGGQGPDELEQACQKVRNVIRLNPQYASKRCIRLGYDDYLCVDDPALCVEQLGIPRWRVICDIFWPHVNGDIFAMIRDRRLLACPEVVDALAGSLGAEDDAMLRTHALAVVWHNLALAGELAYGAGQDPWRGECWKHAIHHWGETFHCERFWDYLRMRVESLDHPSVRPEDVDDDLRVTVPGAVLAFNSLFARSFAQAGDLEACRQHLHLLNESDFPEEARRRAVISAVKTLAVSRLDPLTHRVHETDERHGSTKITRQEFGVLFQPLLDEAMEIRDFLRHDLKLSADLVAGTGFDRFCEKMLRGINRRLQYRGDDRCRSLLYSMLQTQSMLGLPLSRAMQLELGTSIRRDTGYLYEDYEIPEDVDPTECWFFGGEPADPDASIVMPIHLVTQRTSQTVRWKRGEVLVPRSKLAADVHSGRIRVEDIARIRGTAEVRRLEAERQAACDGVDEQVRRAEAEGSRRLQQIEEDGRQRLRGFDARIASQEAEDRAFIDSCQADYDRFDKRRRKMLQDAREKFHREMDQRTREAREAYERTLSDSRGLQGFLGIYLPIGLAAGAILAGVGIVWAGAEFLEGVSRVIRACVGGSIGMGLGIAIAGRVRAARLRRAMAPLSELAPEKARRTREIDAQFEAVKAKAKRKLDAATADARKRITANKSKREAVRKDTEARTQDARKQIQAERSKIRRDSKAKIKRIEDRISAMLTPKKELAKREFPAYQKALSLGYRDGERPPGTSGGTSRPKPGGSTPSGAGGGTDIPGPGVAAGSFSAEEVRTLAVVTRLLGEEGSKSLLELLATMSPDERRRFLRDIKPPEGLL